MRLVIDASILIEYLRNGPVGDRFFTEVQEDKDLELFLPSIVVFELFSGKSTRDSRMVSKIINLLKFFQKIELNEKIARRAGELYRDMAVKIQVPDYIIAASALEIGGKVVTLNRKHFESILGLSLYPL